MRESSSSSDPSLLIGKFLQTILYPWLQTSMVPVLSLWPHRFLKPYTWFMSGSCLTDRTCKALDNPAPQQVTTKSSPKLPNSLGTGVGSDERFEKHLLVGDLGQDYFFTQFTDKCKELQRNIVFVLSWSLMGRLSPWLKVINDPPWHLNGGQLYPAKILKIAICCLTFPDSTK